MKKNFLLPYRFKKIGLCMVVPFLIMECLDFFGVVNPDFLDIPFPYILRDGIGNYDWFGIIKSNDIFNEIWILGILISLMFIALSKEKNEDEMIMQIRLQSMSWALWAVVILFIFETLFFFDYAYALCLFATLYVYLILFALKFQSEMHRIKKGLK